MLSMAQVIIDANVLLSVFELNHDFITDIRKQYPDIATLSVVVDELAKRGDKKGKMALQLIEKANIPVISTQLNIDVDTTLLDFCVSNSAILATQDKRLKERAKQKALKTLGIRQKKYIN